MRQNCRKSGDVSMLYCNPRSVFYCNVRLTWLLVHHTLTLSTLAWPTHKCVFSRTQHSCYIWKTLVCVDLIHLLVLEIKTQVLCGTCSNTPKTTCRLRGANSHLINHRRVSYPLSYQPNTDTSCDDTIVILTVTLTIMHITVKLQYINTFMYK